MVMDRHIELEGAFNFRDLGGYETADGRMIRWRRLYRADGLSRLTPRDMERLAELELATVIDLRTTGELQEYGRIPEPGWELEFHHLPIMEALPDRDEYPAWVNLDYVLGGYARMLETGGPAIAAALRLLADPATYPAVFHCSAGKDRTGILAALVLGFLGVPDEVIVADYALSRAAMERRYRRLLEEHPDRREEIERWKPALLSAEPEVMAGLLDTVRRRYGSLGGYAAAIGAVDALDGLRDALLR